MLMKKSIENVTVSLDAIELSAEPPTEIVLFKAGWNDTKKGKFLFDEEAAEMTMASIADDGRDLIPFDIGHGMLSGGDEGRHKAAGWFKPEIRNGDLLAAEIDWTPATHEALTNREYRFHSPAISYDKSTRRVSGLINVALTNVPATNKQTPIVLDCNKSTGAAAQKETPHMEKLFALLGVSEDQFESSVATLHAEHAELGKAHAELASKFEIAEAELTGIKVASAKLERTARIEALSAEGKLAPAQHEFAASLSAELFEAFAETLSAPIVTPEKVTEQEDDSSQVSLSDIEKDMCVQLGITEEAFLAQKESK